MANNNNNNNNNSSNNIPAEGAAAAGTDNADTAAFHLNQLVSVEPRLWAGINRPGGVGRITKIGYCDLGYVETVDVKYIVGTGSDTMVDLAFVQPHTELQRTSRSRRGRNFLLANDKENEKPKVEEPSAPSRKKKKKAPAATTAATPAKNNKKRRTKSPDAAVARFATATAEATAGATGREVDTKASTKGRLTLQTGGSELRPPSQKKSSAKPPVKYIKIPTNGATNVSPLAMPFVKGEKSSSSKKLKAAIVAASRPKCFVVKRPGDIKNKKQQKDKATPSSTSAKRAAATLTAKKALKPSKKKEAPETPVCYDENKKPPASATAFTAPQHVPRLAVAAAAQAAADKINDMKKQNLLEAARSPPRILPLSSRRIPLRQVFDNDMDVRNDFVEEVVGEQQQNKSSSKVQADPERQILFNQCLGQVFSKFGESITLEALLKHVNQQIVSKSKDDNDKTKAAFSDKEVDDCLADLSDQGRVMVSDGEIYKI